MDGLTSPDHRLFLAGAAAAARPLGAKAQGVQALNIVVIGEPGPLEPTNSAANLVGGIDEHIYEGLYAFNPAYPGWSDTPAVRAAMQDYVKAPDQASRMAAWKAMHAVYYTEVPNLLIGYFSDLYGASAKLQGCNPMMPPTFWNTRLTG